MATSTPARRGSSGTCSPPRSDSPGVVRSDGSIPQGEAQRDLLLKEGVPMRGDRVDLRHARIPAEMGA
jgi:alkylated DNA nucleotide flippase Atl1